MSTSICASVRERAPDLALGALTGPERADVVAHLDGCPSCQVLVGEYASVADALLDLVPGADPATELAPPVLAAMQPVRHRRRRRRVAALVAAATLALTAGTGLTVALVARDQSGGGSTATTSALRSAPMVGAGDVTVGRVVSTGDRPLKLAVSVDYWVPDGQYHVAARNRAGEAAPVGTLEVTDGRGTWTGSTPAVPHPVAVSLVDQSGATVCEGRLA
jgi:predicted anti-sigma-YlaC factor YlaD